MIDGIEGGTPCRGIRTGAWGLALTALLGLGLLAGCQTQDDVSGSAGMLRPLEIGGHVWGDRNQSGQQEAEEESLPGFKVELWRDIDGDGTCDERVEDTVSDAAGDYTFSVTTEGAYCVGAVDPAKGEPIDASVLTPSFNVSAGEVHTENLGLN